MSITRNLSAGALILLLSGTTSTTSPASVTGGTQSQAQDSIAVPLSCEPGAVSVDINRSPGVRFERVERPSGPFTEPREFSFSQGSIRRVRLFLSASVPEGGVGRGSEARLEAVVQTSPSATDVTAPVTWWRLVRLPSDDVNAFDNTAETLLFDAKTLAPCFNAEPCKFADVAPASDSATAMLVLGFTRDLGGANANNWEHARLVLDFREETPRVAVAVNCGYNEGGGACTAFDSGEMPRSELSCSWDASGSDFACIQNSDVLGHRDFQLLSGRPGGSRDGEVASLEAAALRLAARAPGAVEVVTGLGRVRHVHDVTVGRARIMVLASKDRFHLVDRMESGIGAIRTIRPQPLVPSTDSSDERSDVHGWTDPSDPVFSAGEIFRDAQLVVLRIVEASRDDSTAAPRPYAMYWLALSDLTAAALTMVDPGSYGGCGVQVVPAVITAVGRIPRSFDVPVTVQPPTSVDLEARLTWQSEIECRRPGRVRWRRGRIEVLVDNRACAATERPLFPVLGFDGSIHPSATFPIR